MITQAYFDDIEAQLLKELDLAQESIIVAVAWFTNTRLLIKLCEMCRANVSVDLMILDDENNNSSSIDFSQFKSLGGLLYKIPKGVAGSLMHNKFCVIDKKTVITGSYNWSYNAIQNHENITVSHHAEILAKQFTNEFLRLKEHYFGKPHIPLNIDSKEESVNRLSLIKHMIELRELGAIQTQIDKLRGHGFDNLLSYISKALEDSRFDTAVNIINEYSLGRQVVSDIDFLRFNFHRNKFAINILSCFYPLSSALLGRFRDSWSWGALSESSSLEWSQELIAQFADYWNWRRLSENQYLPWTEELVASHEDRWLWGILSSSKFLPWSPQLIERFVNRWDWIEMSSNESLPWSAELIARYKDKWSWSRLSTSKSLPWSEALISEHEERWDWYWLSRNESLPWSRWLHFRFRQRWHREALSVNKMFVDPGSSEFSELGVLLGKSLSNSTHQSSRYLFNEVDIVTGTYGDAFNRNQILLTPDLLREYMLSLVQLERKYGKLPENRISWTKDSSWVWSAVSKDHLMPWSETILERFSNYWDWSALSRNSHLPWTQELIARFEDRWDWERLSHNRALPWSASLLERFTQRWYWRSLSLNTSLPWSETLLQYFSDKWDWHDLSLSESLPWSITLINMFSDNWDWYLLGYNHRLYSLVLEPWMNDDIVSSVMSDCVPQSE